ANLSGSAIIVTLALVADPSDAEAPRGIATALVVGGALDAAEITIAPHRSATAERAPRDRAASFGRAGSHARDGEERERGEDSNTDTQTRSHVVDECRRRSKKASCGARRISATLGQPTCRKDAFVLEGRGPT